MVIVAETGEAALLLANRRVVQNPTVEKDMSKRNFSTRKAASFLFKSVKVFYQFCLKKEN